jgi:hypothetical protein
MNETYNKVSAMSPNQQPLQYANPTYESIAKESPKSAISALIASQLSPQLPRRKSKSPRHRDHQEFQGQSTFPGASATIKDSNLLKEYEKEINRQDININGSLTKTATGIFSEIASSMIPQLPPTNVSQEDFSEMDSLKRQQLKSSLRQELNMTGITRLLDFIELEMADTKNPDKYYRLTGSIQSKNKSEIIR